MFNLQKPVSIAVKKILPVLFIGFITVACFQDIQNDINRIGPIVWNPTVGIPVSTGTFTFSDFQEKLNSGDVSIEADGNGLLTMVY